MAELLETRFLKNVALVMALLMTVIGFVPRAEAGFVAAHEALSQTRSQDLATVERVLQNKVVKQRLQEFGYSDQEVKDRLAQLSDQDLQQLAGKINTLAPAGDGFGFVIGVLIVAILVVILWLLVDKHVTIH